VYVYFMFIYMIFAVFLVRMYSPKLVSINTSVICTCILLCGHLVGPRIWCAAQVSRRWKRWELWATSHTSQEPWPRDCERPKESVRRPSRDAYKAESNIFLRICTHTIIISSDLRPPMPIHSMTCAHPCPPMLFKLRPCIQKLCNVYCPPTPSLG
jgi:hypothetical protein